MVRRASTLGTAPAHTNLQFRKTGTTKDRPMSLFSQTKQPAEAAKTGAAPSTDGKKSAGDTVSSTLAGLPRETDGRIAGQLQILGFDNLREHLGAEWEKCRRTVHIAAENIISTHLGPGDISTRIGGDHYLIVFANTDPGHGEEITAKIAKKICAVLIGRENSGLIKVETSVGKVENAGSPTASITPTTATPKKLVTAPAATQSADGKIVSPTTALAASLNKAKAHRHKEYTIGYYPIWNMKHDVMIGFAVLPYISKGAGPLLEGHDVLGDAPSEARICELDVNMLRAQLEMAAELYSNDFATLLLTQIHYSTLQNNHALQKLYEVAKEIPPFLKKTLMVELLDLPDTNLTSAAVQRIAGLSRFFRTVVIRVPSLSYPITNCTDMKATCVAYKVPPGTSPEKLLTEGRKFAHIAKALRLMTSFEQIADIELAAQLKEAGAIFGSGTFLGGPFDVPGNMKRVTVDQLRSDSFSPY